MKKNVLSLNEIDSTMNPLVGGKGANLGEMTQAGLPVPPGFCITTNVFTDLFGSLSNETLSPEEIQQTLRESELSKEAKEEIYDALSHFPDDTLFSVRSSATAEDLPFASFAGQQDTYLNVKKEDIEQAILDCFASLYTDRAIIYRQQNNIEEPTMAVVVQKMVNSEASGIMFTADPITGNRSNLIIDSIFGLGEAIVSGQVSPDHIIVDRKKGGITETIENKTFALYTDQDGSIHKTILNTDTPVLSKKQIEELVELGEKIEDHYKRPQDIEWAIENNTLYLLQTRAITSLYPAPELNDHKDHFFYNMGYQQMNPVAMPKLAQDMMKGLTNFHNYDLNEYQSTFVYPIGQHIFLDLSTILSIQPIRKVFLDNAVQIMDPLLEGALKELFQRDLDLTLPDPIVLKKLFKALRQFPKYLLTKDPKKMSEDIMNSIEEKLNNTEEEFRNLGYSSEDLNTLFKNLNLIDTFILTFFPMVFSGLISLKRLEEVEKKLGSRGRWTEVIQLGNEGNVVTEMNLHLGDLADYLVKDQDLKEKLESEDFDLETYLKTHDDPFTQTFNSFIDKYGFRGAGEIDISRPRWKEDLKPLVTQILSISNDKELNSHRIDHLDKVIRAKEASIEMIEETRERLGESKAREVARNLKRFRYFYALREHLKYYWVKLLDLAKGYFLKLGNYLYNEHRIKTPEDIFHLSLTDIEIALSSNEDLRPLIKERKTEFQRVLKLTPPRIITSDGEVLMGGIIREDIPENALAGLGISAGQVEGIAKVVLDPETSQVEKGEILVAPFTDPGWTPLFVNAKALVTEVGGALTHGAVVAREYGIPGVVGVKDATKAIKTGQRILVDGTAGIITFLDKEES